MIRHRYLPPEFMQFLSTGDIHEESQEISRQFIDYVSANYPLVAVMMHSVDWKRIANSTSIEATHATDDEIQHFISTTTVSQSAYVGLVRSKADPIFIMSIPFFIREIDLLTVLLPHVGWFIAADKNDNTFTYSLDTFLEWKVSGGMRLSGILKV